MISGNIFKGLMKAVLEETLKENIKNRISIRYSPQKIAHNILQIICQWFWIFLGILTLGNVNNKISTLLFMKVSVVMNK